MASAEKLAFYLLKKVNKAIRDYELIDDGDRIAVAVSGGKDSLSLLKLLAHRRSSVREDYELVALHVQSDIQCNADISRVDLSGYSEDRGLSTPSSELLSTTTSGNREGNPAASGARGIAERPSSLWLTASAATSWPLDVTSMTWRKPLS